MLTAPQAHPPDLTGALCVAPHPPQASATAPPPTSSTTQAPAPTDSGSDSGGSNTGAIVGAVVGSVCGVALIAGVTYFVSWGAVADCLALNVRSLHEGQLDPMNVARRAEPACSHPLPDARWRLTALLCTALQIIKRRKAAAATGRMPSVSNPTYDATATGACPNSAVWLCMGGKWQGCLECFVVPTMLNKPQ